MSDDSISYGEDKENLLYISKKINVDEFGLGDEEDFRESIPSTGSDATAKPVGSEIKILEGISFVPQTFSDPQVAQKFKPFNLKWSFGMNAKVGLINLSSDNRKELFFSSVHSAIVYNYCTKEMRHLEGHQAIVNCISSDSWGEWLVSSDGDKDGCLIVWSAKDLCPVYTLFNLYPESGILLMAMSPCARYLVTIGATFDEYYAVDFWLWTLGEDKANDRFLVHATNGTPIKICFHPDMEEHIMLVFEKQAYFILWNPVAKKLEQSVIPHLTNKNKVGQLTCGTYMRECHESYVSSSRGYVLVFRSTLYGRSYEDGELNNSKMYINAIKVTPASIGAITTTDGVLVVGDSRGHILFFDKKVRILYWIKNISVGALTSIGFSISPKLYHYENSQILIRERPLEDDIILDCQYENLEEEITKLIDAPFDATLNNKAFTVRDFFMSTVECNIYAYDFIRNICTPLFQVADANISSIDAHDEMPYIVIGYENGRIALINFEKKELVASYYLPRDDVHDHGDIVTCIKYSNQSLHLVCGRANGQVWILEPVILKPKVSTPFAYSNYKIEKIEFSHNALQFAYYNSNRTVALFDYNLEQNGWVFRGKIRSHYDDIHDMRFIQTREDSSSILYTIGADRYLVEYNNLEIRSNEGVSFGMISRERIEQTAVPMTFTHYEKVVAKRTVGYFLLADDKVLPMQRSRYMIFITEKHIGIHMLPLDGNPYKYTGYLAHPRQVADFVLSYCGTYAFTYGIQDRCILQWEIKPRYGRTFAILGLQRSNY